MEIFIVKDTNDASSTAQRQLCISQLQFQNFDLFAEALDHRYVFDILRLERVDAVRQQAISIVQEKTCAIKTQ